jgi:phage terminase small subunit
MPTKSNKKEWKPTCKQQRFIDAYDGNAAEAARIAGYAHAEAQGRRLLRNVRISASISERERKRATHKIASREQRQAFWTETMQNPKNDLKDRLKASELLGRSNADFTEKRILQGDKDKPLELAHQVNRELDQRVKDVIGADG